MLKYLLYAVYALIGISLGAWLFPELITLLPFEVPRMFNNILVYGLLGVILFYLLFGWTLKHAYNFLKKSEGYLLSRSLTEIVFATLGMVLGLVIAVLITLLINTLEIPLVGEIIPIVSAVIFGYLGFIIGLRKFSEVLDFFPKSKNEQKGTTFAQKKFVDTSVIIDGRIVDIAETGFLEGEIIIPQFVLDELQLIADATDPVKREKGQRGLDMLNKLQEKNQNISIEAVPYDKLDVDQQLIDIAKEQNGAILTTDYNLNKICQLHDITVLNVNELSNAIKTVVVQGDVFELFISKTGKEENQGVGYLEDGTMVVVENGEQLINQTVKIIVTSVLQTNSGRIVFAKREKK
ncbi:PIN/TRAM domain-containing protein [Jeotgalicoccus meleagridis]|uniref:Putative PIN and TRAM-domain containing protein n=1 Tax=Jeotgalicoccus meleagridis TaxID=2759181 RepID=A0A6V7RC29_9STAP|nr:PIN domain-containing protein [Jeotgalicoccus meleagridis]CAD2074438.1 putative PIN and TRAM-domain containing protein precursor [Jeotgalicoccus meleagridis]HIW39297.1 PIN/TRAM domain-containing protein [Candidatus Jeotgalicoccus stercoravium]